MIKFEERDGLIFKMLDKPVPLKENDENVLVRFITHGVIGEYVMEHWLDCNQENLPIYVEDVDSDGDVTVWIENGNEHICCPFPMFEIIGTLVAEGSDDWALYQMMQGKWVVHEKAYPCHIHANMITWSNTETPPMFTMQTPETWLSENFLHSGWQIYKEPKPLLAEAKVGDLVKLRNGSYSQIVEVKDGSVFKYQNPEAIERSRVALFLCDENGDTSRWGKVKDVDIISTEPLATKGTKEWALQMMKLGKCVCHVKAPSIKYHRPTHYVKRVVRENCTDDMSDAVWMEGADTTGWQIHEEPKPQYKVGDWVEIESSHVKGKTFVSVITEMPNQEHYTVRVNSYFGGYTVYGVTERQIIRKLKPSEIIVRIGCLSGTTRYRLFFDSDGEKHDAIKIFNSNGKSIAIIQLEALDTQTRELVESLLNAQERGDIK